MVLDIIKYGDTVLRKRGLRVNDIGEHKLLIQNMFDTMKYNHGIGLSAHQVGTPIRLFLVDLEKCDENYFSFSRVDTPDSWPHGDNPMILINPKIIPYGEKVVFKEGCLSIPNFRKSVTRQSHVRVYATSVNDKDIRFSTNGILARAIQHEYDHINGILIVDK